jgi:hypothetical protein
VAETLGLKFSNLEEKCIYQLEFDGYSNAGAMMRRSNIVICGSDNEARDYTF